MSQQPAFTKDNYKDWRTEDGVRVVGIRNLDTCGTDGLDATFAEPVDIDGYASIIGCRSFYMNSDGRIAGGGKLVYDPVGPKAQFVVLTPGSYPNFDNEAEAIAHAESLASYNDGCEYAVAKTVSVSVRGKPPVVTTRYA